MNVQKNDDELLVFLTDQFERATDTATGTLSHDRADAMSGYMRQPYGNEREGLSQVVASDIFDSVEGVCPNLLEIFVSTDRAVQFEPQTEEDVEICEQSTDLCNFIFWRQNSGYLVLQDAFKDALILKNGAIKWFWEDKEVTSMLTKSNQSEMDLALLMVKQPNLQIMSQEAGQSIDAGDGTQIPTYTVKLKRIDRKQRVAINAVPPENILISDDWRTPLLADCPYVCHMEIKSLSDMLEMGLEVTADDVRQADDVEYNELRSLRDRTNDDDYASETIDNHGVPEPLLRGWLFEEYVLFDKDGDGIAERVKVIRLGKKILLCEPCSHVPIAIASPYTISHRAIGLGLAEVVDDVQKMKTDIQRQMLDNHSFSNMLMRTVLTDTLGNPKANIDDILSPVPGGVIREYVTGAVRETIMPYSGNSALPLVEYLDGIKENRTGYTRHNQGLDADSLNKTKGGMQMLMNASQKRLMAMARNLAEAMIAPMLIGVMQTLTENGAERIAFPLRNKFVEVDPSEWVNKYNIQINVGIGSGDTQQKAQMLEAIDMAQQRIAASGGLGKLLTEKNMYNLQVAKLDNAGFKNAQEYWLDPDSLPKPDPNAPPPPNPEIEKTRMQMEADAQKFQAQTQITMQTKQMELQSKERIEAENIASKERIAMMNVQQQGQLEQSRVDMMGKPAVSINGSEVFEQAGQQMQGLAMQQNEMMSQALIAIQQSQEQTAQLMAAMVQAITAPKQATLSNGKTITVQTMGTLNG